MFDWKHKQLTQPIVGCQDRKVILYCRDAASTELHMTPNQARVMAARLRRMADVAEEVAEDV